MDADQERIVTFADVLDYMGSHERTAHDKGDLWERVCAWYLRNDPEMQQVVGRVWRWDDAENPLRTGHDTGIDIVAERADEPGTYWAVQCKNFDAGHKLSQGDLATFFAAAEADDRYTGLMVATAGEEISSTVEDHLLTLRANRGTASLTLSPSVMAQSNVDWSLLVRDRAETEEERWARTYNPRPHQLDAINQIQTAFERHDRAKAVMACGTGKTLTALRLAERRMAGSGCRDVLFCAPSIALVAQAMREWTNQARVPFRSLVVCSDAKASRVGADDLLDSVVDVGFPATTDARALLDNYRWTRERYPEALIVVFSTYQSMQVVQDAQDMGLPRFGLCVCDEAHRTAGTRYAEDEDVACYQIVVDGERVRADKRLFMTATPKVYGDNVKTRAGEAAAELYSMDDEEKYGPVAYEMTFAEAVEKGLLCDYRVVVLAINQDAVPGTKIVVAHGDDATELDIGDKAKIIGCWRGLATHGEDAARRLDGLEGDEAADTTDFLLVDDFDSWDEDGLADILGDPDSEVKPLRRAVGFCSTIQSSKNIDEAFAQVVDAYVQSTGDQGGPACRLDHVDGSMDSKVRAKKLDWLASGDDPNECRILTNARCLAEGVDVPSLDAVIFFAPKRSKVDVVQAVGRVMRTFHKGQADEKKLGYIILPVAIPSEMTAVDALNQSDTFDVVWGVLQALRSHDQRIDAYINSLPMRKPRKKDGELGIGRGGGQGDGEEGQAGGSPAGGADAQMTIDFGVTALERAVYAKAVEKCGNKVFWSSWAEDVGRIAQAHIGQIQAAVASDPVAREAMDSFLRSLRDSLNPGITEQAAIEMVAQHKVTLPVFEALFGDYAFAKSNPVSVAITGFLDALEGHGVGDLPDEDTRSLDELYASVRRRASFCRTDSNRQTLIKDLYNDFFAKAFARTSEKLGIVYTPLQIVDYMLHATDRALEREFGRRLCDEGVHVLDPFAGTGSYMAQLVSDPELMPLDALPAKYAGELHSNELVLLAYYIMVVNIEYAYHSRVGGDYVPFEGALFTDTFQMDEGDDELDLGMFVDNSERVVHQQETPITVIVGNPPYSAGQKNANDDNQNEHYPTLEARIESTYVAKSQSSLNRQLYDSYIEAFRWASDRIGDEGIVSFVTNAGWLRSDQGAGVRRCFTEEFNSIYVFDLLGNQRTQGEESRRQGGKVFGGGCRAPIAITTLIKNPASEERGAIHYFCVGEYKTQEEKLTTVASYRDREPEWETLEQDRHGDWLDQRDEAWYELAPIALEKFKQPNGLFATYSLGVSTNKDSWTWAFGEMSLVEHMTKLIDGTNAEIERVDGDAAQLNYDKKRFAWTAGMKKLAASKAQLAFNADRIVPGNYRPFCMQRLYFDHQLIERPGQNLKLFPLVKPNECAPNVDIALTGGNNYSCLVSNVLPDLHFVGDSQCFPLYWYEKDDGTTLSLMPQEGEKAVRDAWGNRYVRHDAITDEALKVFRDAYPMAFATRPKTYGGTGISKEDLFWYVYGILHSPEYRERFSANLQKELPRVPLAADFEAFSKAGRALGELHLGYESAEPWPNLEIGGVLPGEDPGRVEKLKWGRRRNPETGKLEADKTVLVYNKRVSIRNIPEGANDYVVNGRSPLEWMIDRYQVKTDKATGIVNDPNEYSDDPRYILDLICRLVTVSVKTSEIVASLPAIREIEKPASWPAAWKAGA